MHSETKIVHVHKTLYHYKP